MALFYFLSELMLFCVTWIGIADYADKIIPLLSEGRTLSLRDKDYHIDDNWYGTGKNYC
ncbi:MAG: hypothetical protein ACR5K4_02740 [Sodalis sp. (in: enterobacteria)]